MSKRFYVLEDSKQRELIAAAHTDFFQTYPYFRGGENLTEEDKQKPFIGIDSLDWLHDARGQLIFSERRSLENNLQYRQLLPYVLIRCTEGPTPGYLIYQRVKHTNEAKLMGNTSMGLGGHIDITDLVIFEDTSIVDWESVITLNIRRELTEETGVVETFALCDTSSLGIILDDSEDNNAVGKVHVGIVQVINVDWNTIEQMKLKMDTDEAEARYVGVFTVEEIRKDQAENNGAITGKLEPWTRILLDSGVL